MKIEKIEEITSTLSSIKTLEGKIQQQEQLTSSLGKVTQVSSNCFMIGSIEESDWLEQGNNFYYILERKPLGLINLFVDYFMVQGDEGQDDCIIAYTRLPNGDIRFKANFRCNAEFRIGGNK